jgi:hypothetical protein
MTSTFSEDGYFIAFPKPIDAITTPPLSSQDWGICLHNDWLPAILGALTVLQRRETWKGSPEDVQTCVENVRSIIAHIGDPCSTEYPLIVCCYDFQGNESELGWSPTKSSGVDQAGWVGAGWSAVYNPAFGRYVLSIDIPVPAGSNIDTVSVRYTSVENLELCAYQHNTHVTTAGFCTLCPLGVDEIAETAATNAESGYCQVTLTAVLSSFVLYEVCVSLRNPTSECP